MMIKPTPRTIVITGASSGIGAALAKEFAQQGFNLGLLARRIDKLEALKTQLKADYPALQIEIGALDVDQTVTIKPALNTLFKALGQVDIVVVNAGINRFTKVGRANLADDLAILQTNVLGAIATVYASAEWLINAGSGHIVGISSLAARNTIPTQAAYCASKAAFSNYLETTQIELAVKNVLVTQIQPGFIKTEIMANIEKYPFAVTTTQAAKEMAKLILSRRKMGIVPAYPWKYLVPLIALLPRSIVRRFL